MGKMFLHFGKGDVAEVQHQSVCCVTGEKKKIVPWLAWPKIKDKNFKVNVK